MNYNSIYVRKETNWCRGLNGKNCNWDDTMLIEAYDKAVNKAKVQIVQKLKKELNLGEEDVNFILGPNGGNLLSTLDKNSKLEQNKEKRQWKVGDRCRCIYWEDGKEYEAKIISLIDDNYCRVKYIGYGNKEDILLNDLAPSLEETEIQAQKETAAMSDTPSEEGEYTGESEEELLPEMDSESTSAYPSTSPLPSRVPMYNDTWPPTPPPPPPPMYLFNGLPSMGPGISEHFDSMLMSWYLSGYYSGRCCAATEKFLKESRANKRDEV